MKKISSLLALLFIAFSAQAQLLWKISGNGLEKPSYVIGTYHLAPVSFADSIPGLKAALDASEQVYGELDMNEMKDIAKVMKMQQAMMLPEGQTLDKLLTAEQLTRLNVFLTATLGADLSNPMVAAQLGKFSPTALCTQLTLVKCMKKTPGFNPNDLFDGYFQKVAAEQNKPTGGLETMEFQTQMLYQGKTLERQVVNLMCFVDNEKFNDEVSDLILKAFFTQDLDGIATALDMELEGDCATTPEEEDALIYDRNANWAKQLPAIMQAKSTFLAVGAGHLPGERGLLNLLRQAGYTVEGVK